MISKELLSIIEFEELSIVNADFISCKLKNNEIVIKCKYLHTKLTPTFYYNIYELAHKCKEWALEHDCELLSCIKSKDRAICDIYSNKYDCKFTHYGETEPEAIFKACEWILTKDSK